MHCAILIFYGLMLKLGIASYVLEDDYASDTFFGLFDFFTVSCGASL